MIRWRVCDIVERLAHHRDYMRLANFERVRGFDTERKLLRRPTKHCLSNFTPLWANRNFGADRSNVVSAGIPEKPSTFHPRAQRIAFRRRDAHRQRRLFARENPPL